MFLNWSCVVSSFQKLEGQLMREVEIGVRLLNARRLRMWTQGRLAKEAGVSPTTVSGIETGKIARPHFGTLHKLAQALDIDPQVLLSPSEEPSSASEEPSGVEGSPFLSLQWARSTRVESFDQLLEGASLEKLKALVQELEDERERLQRLYGEFPEGSEQRRFIKGQIRDTSAQSASVATSIMFHSDKDAEEHTDGSVGT
jgi:transcriptional regulator with XRE-family HTH domain